MFYNQPLAHRFGKALADDLESGEWQRAEIAVAWVRRSGTKHVASSFKKFLRAGGLAQVTVGVDIEKLRRDLDDFLSRQMDQVPEGQRIVVQQTVAFGRIMKRALQHVTFSSKEEVYRRAYFDSESTVNPEKITPQTEYEVKEGKLTLLLHTSATDETMSGAFTTEATVKVWVGPDGSATRHVHTAEGNGPVNAIDTALRAAVSQAHPSVDRIHLTDYKVRIINGSTGTAAKTRVLIESTDGKRDWRTVGVSENIIEASLQALVDSMEYALLKK